MKKPKNTKKDNDTYNCSTFCNIISSNIVK